MKIGNLRKQVAIQAEQQTADGAGGYALAWVTLATVWADISSVTGNKIYTAGHLEGHVSHTITMRWRNDITVTSDMRILYGARSFNIHAALNQDEGTQFLTLLVEEGTSL